MTKPTANSLTTLFSIPVSMLQFCAILLAGCTPTSPDSIDTESDTDSPSDTGTASDTATASDTGTASDINSDTDSVTDSGRDSDTDTGVASCVDDPALAEQDADILFNYDHVPTFNIYLPEDEWTTLQANAVDEEWTKAEACFEGKRIGTVGIRFKGSYGTLYGCFDEDGNMTCPRLSLKLKFSKYDKALRFFGLKRLNFNANTYDDSRMKEKIAYDLYREMGIVAPRASWAVVKVNGQSYGLYGMVEELDGRFTEDRWPENPNGNLYKELWPTVSDKEEITAALRTNEDDGDVSGFVAFSEAMKAAQNDAEVLEVLGQYTDLDYWARYLAVDEAILSYDGITYFYADAEAGQMTINRNHNFYFYEDAPSHFSLVPWDVESSFWINPDHEAPDWTVKPEDCSLTYSYWGGLATAPGCDPVFSALNSDLANWKTVAQELLDGPFDEQKMLDTIDAHEAFINEEASAEETPTRYGSFSGAVDSMRSAIPRLRERLERMIAE